ncbi:restriction system-associated AAA family ATPase [Chryseobacterium gleum]|uniref:restriction system-associated AAA family ATPase n=1 Tax=Chryseobacterium gleum TaxID=250 RepID=UPI0028AE736F|nr:restriction system-associated AAA family ATPase [Chryseobacterium gleum]
MKLLRLKIENKEGFRSLQQNFEINFHSLAETHSMGHFRPFCFAGLNGSGKSNVLEALANIFYHLELCVAKFLPDSIKNSKNFKRSECTPDAFTLEYIIGQHNRKYYTPEFFDKIIISKKSGEEPGIKVYSYPFDEENLIIPNLKTIEEDRKIGFVNSSGKILQEQDKIYLPAHVVGYSSGENEILSLPFIKSRLIHLDEYLQTIRDGYREFDEPENSLIYIDNNMSQAVLLTCLLFEDEATLAPLRDVDNTGILGLKSFRININQHDIEFRINGEIQTQSIMELLDQRQIEFLKKCSTSWFSDTKSKKLCLDFYVNDATKNAFKKYFNDNALECFHLFRLLYELNNYFIDEETKADVYRSKGIYTNGKLPTPSPSQDVFHFLDFYITKELKKTEQKKDLLLRSFSDGEHQFIHTMGICLLLKDRRTLLLLDEPETHFNPSWRAKFVKVLNDSIEAGGKGKSFNVHLLKDVLLTSHSPFIISDCLPDNVILFEKEKNGKTTAKKVSELENSFNTYGTSVELILDRLFDYNQSIGDLSLSEIDKININQINTSEEIAKAKATLRKFGESIEKDMVLSQLNRKLKDNQNATNL